MGTLIVGLVLLALPLPAMAQGFPGGGGYPDESGRRGGGRFPGESGERGGMRGDHQGFGGGEHGRRPREMKPVKREEMDKAVAAMFNEAEFTAGRNRWAARRTPRQRRAASTGAWYPMCCRRRSARDARISRCGC